MRMHTVGNQHFLSILQIHNIVIIKADFVNKNFHCAIPIKVIFRRELHQGDKNSQLVRFTYYLKEKYMFLICRL